MLELEPTQAPDTSLSSEAVSVIPEVVDKVITILRKAIDVVFFNKDP